MPKQKRNTIPGFTLIELLVVIAIIGVLSSVVLSSLNSARERANNAQRISSLRQWTTALELFRQDTGNYPVVTSPTCLGNAVPRCWSTSTSFTSSATLNTQLQPYISPSAQPASIEPNNGFLYFTCPSTGLCTQAGYGIVWFLQGVNRSCAPGAVFADGSGFGQTYCAIFR